MDSCLLCYRAVSISSTSWAQNAHWVSVLELQAQYRRAGTRQGLERQLSELRCQARILLKHEDKVARKIENAPSIESLFFLFLPISMNTVSCSHIKLSVVLHAYKKTFTIIISSKLYTNPAFDQNRHLPVIHQNDLHEGKEERHPLCIL